MSNTFKLVKEFMSAMKASEQNKTQPYDTQGTVKRVEGSTAWIQFTGADRETPVQMTIACEVGDTVQARVGGGSAWLTGNLTAPPTDDKKANQALSMVTTTVQTIKEEVEEALEEMSDEGSDVEDVVIQYCLSDSSSTFIQYGDWSDTPPEYVSGKYYWTRSVIEDDEGNITYGTPRYSQDTQLTVETDIAFKSNNNHFWHDSSGAYVTTSDKSYSSGYATRITTNGILQSYNGNLLSSWTGSGIGFYAGDGATASSSTKLADFGTSGMNVYANGTSVASFGSVVRLGATTNASYTEVNATGLDVKDTSSGDTISVGASGISGFVGSNFAWGIDTYTPTVGTNYGIYIRSKAGQSITIKNNISLNGTVHIDAVEPTTLFNVTSISLDQYEGLSGSGNIAGSTTVTNGGYYPLGVVGLSIATGGAYSRGAYLSNESTGSCTVNIRVYNTGSGSVTATAYILWVAA
jgi:hypothetical protein